MVKQNKTIALCTSLMGVSLGLYLLYKNYTKQISVNKRIQKKGENDYINPNLKGKEVAGDVSAGCEVRNTPQPVTSGSASRVPL